MQARAANQQPAARIRTKHKLVLRARCWMLEIIFKDFPPSLVDQALSPLIEGKAIEGKSKTTRSLVHYKNSENVVFKTASMLL